MTKKLLHQYFQMMTVISRIQMWEVVCGTPKTEQGIIVLLQSLTGNKKAEKLCLH